MRVIQPLSSITSIDEAMLTSSTCAEPHASETEYDAGDTYALGDLVISTTSHRKYESLQAGNIGHALPSAPTLDNPSPSNAWWQDIGPSNRWAMFDVLRDTKTVHASPLTVVITPGMRVNSLALFGLVADAFTVTITSGGSTVYSHTENLSTREVFNWYDYYFEPFSTRESAVLWDLPPYTNAVITITITRSSGDVSCGACVVGSYEFIGRVLSNAEDDKLNFSRIERDFAGGSLLRPRRNVPKTSQQLLIDKNRIRRVRAVREALNAVPAVWSGLDDDAEGYFESLFILGYYRRFSINLENTMHARISLELEEI